ncbi:MAG: hypothetical protein CMM15_06305 [Rhodospirillaceae bacterium]|nr:hypothetical protein [Rhodospirillaceae bacterium]
MSQDRSINIDTALDFQLACRNTWQQGFSALTSVISNGSPIIFIIILLFVVDYFVALIIWSIFTFFFLLCFFVQRSINWLGQFMVETNRLRCIALNEAFRFPNETKFKKINY